jgi:hypothetical protein
LDDIISRSFSRWVDFWHWVKLTTSILHININTNGGSWRIRGERDSGRGGLGLLGGRLLDSRLLSSEKKGIRDGKQQNNEEGCPKITLTWAN